jgi:hypothetical protein
MSENELMLIEDIQKRIYTIRGVQVMLDVDLADIYRFETRVLNQATRGTLKDSLNSFAFNLQRKNMNF